MIELLRRRSFVALLLSLLLVVTSTSVLRAQSTPPKREFRAAWVATVINLDWPSSPGLPSDQQKQQLVDILDDLHATGLNAVVFQVRAESDAFYDSPLEPWSYWLTGTQGAPPSPYYDPLAFAVEEAHKRGMELHAWFNPYRVIRPSSYTRAANHLSNTHPEWLLGFSDITILDPGIPEARQHVINVVMDIVARYDIDGIHADDYFYPYPPNQISNQDDASYAAYNPGSLSRGDWRRNNVNVLLQAIYDSIQTVKPHVKFGMSPFGIWKNGVPSGIVGLDAYNTIYCDAVAWLQGQYVDYLTPQLYWQIGGGQDYSKLMPWWATQLNGRHLYPGHAPYRINSSNWTSSELPNQVRLNRANRFQNVLGSVFFRARNGVTDNLKGFADSLSSDLYRHRALIPPMSWKDGVPPLAASNLRYESSGSGPAMLRWNVPPAAADGDTASRYVVYRYPTDPSPSPDIDDPANILFVSGSAAFDAPIPSTDSGSYYYVVTSLDRNHNEGAASPVLQVTSPSSPSIALPADSTPGLPDSILFAWTGVGGASRYTFEVWNESLEGVPILTRVVSDTATISSGFEGQTTYAWRVRAANAGGSGAFSAPARFTTGFPVTPSLVSPADFTTNVPPTVELTWQTSPAAETYRIQLSKNSEFSPLELDSSFVADTSISVAGLSSYTIYFWRVQAFNAVGGSKISQAWKFRTQTITGIADAGLVPDRYELFQNYPNPFNPSTVIRFALPEDAVVHLRIYDILGREIRNLITGASYGPGTYSVPWNGTDDNGIAAANGVYIYRLEAKDFSRSKRMILIR